MNLELMAIKEYSTLPRTSELDPYRQMADGIYYHIQLLR